MWGGWSIGQIPLDALPEISDTQVILYSRWDRSPDLIEDQVTYPIVTAMLGAPKVKAVRGVSDFGSSIVYVVFEDGTDLYWARSRTLEYLVRRDVNLAAGRQNRARTRRHQPGLGLSVCPHGQLRQGIARGITRGTGLLSSLSPAFSAGVAEVASVGGFVPQYQVTADPARLRALGIPVSKVVEAVRQSNVETGGRLHGVRRLRVHDPRARLSEESPRPRRGGGGGRRTQTPCASRMSARSRWVRKCAVGWSTSMGGGDRLRDRRHASGR